MIISKNYTDNSLEYLSNITFRTKNKVTKDLQIKVGNYVAETNYTSIPLFNPLGDVIGTLDFSINQTDIKKANQIIEKVSIYQKREISKLLGTLTTLATGDMTVRYPVTRTDDTDTKDIYEEFLNISNAIRESLEALTDTLNKVNNSSELINNASTEIASNSQSLAEGASTQASSLEEISASIHSFAEQTNNNAQNAEKANTISNSAMQKAHDGNKLMQNLQVAMADINESSTKISNIIKVIDEIAFQTNILSLNAAVEAARAGKHGKGFAVVAEEVRNLAQRSAKAAKETSEIIETTISKVNNGNEITDSTASALNEIVNASTKVTELIQNITKSSVDQSYAIQEISKALTQIETITQSTAANAEESSSASEELSHQSKKLNELAKRFKLK